VCLVCVCLVCVCACVCGYMYAYGLLLRFFPCIFCLFVRLFHSLFVNRCFVFPSSNSLGFSVLKFEPLFLLSVSELLLTSSICGESPLVALYMVLCLPACLPIYIHLHDPSSLYVLNKLTNNKEVTNKNKQQIKKKQQTL